MHSQFGDNHDDALTPSELKLLLKGPKEIICQPCHSIKFQNTSPLQDLPKIEAIFGEIKVFLNALKSGSTRAHCRCG